MMNFPDAGPRGGARGEARRWLCAVELGCLTSWIGNTFIVAGMLAAYALERLTRDDPDAPFFEAPGGNSILVAVFPWTGIGMISLALFLFLRARSRQS